MKFGQASSAVVKVVIFAALTTLLTALLATLIGNIRLVDSHTYHGIFSDAAGVNKGDRVRLSGVEVGTVKDVQMHRQGGRYRAKIEFTVDSSVPVYRDAELELRYETIVGQRYLAIVETAGSAQPLADGSTVPLAQTRPALNLTTLFNGFQPLFQGLDPNEVNDLSDQIVRSLQGEGPSVAALLKHTASLTTSLADRDEAIGKIVTNLNSVLGTVANRDKELSALITQFRDLMVTLKDRKDDLGTSLPPLANLLTTTEGVVRAARPDIASDVTALSTLSGQLHDTRSALDASLKRTRTKMRAVGRTGAYGSWFTFYVCGIGVQVQLLNGTANLSSPAVASNEKDTVCGAGGIQ